MPTTLSNIETTEIMENLVRRRFDEIDLTMDFIYNEADGLIQTARRYGMEDIAVKMETDIKTELC